MRFEKHVFICTNDRDDQTRKSCGFSCGMELVRLFKKELHSRGLNKKIRAQRAGCLDACEVGPSLVIYPEGVYYQKVETFDVNEIIEKHLIKGQVIKRLLPIETNK